MTTTEPRSWKLGCKTEPSEDWAYNALRFPTREMALTYGKDLHSRWLTLREFEPHPSDDPVLYYDDNRQMVTE